MNEFIPFLPAFAVEDFLSEQNIVDKLRIAVSALGKSHNAVVRDRLNYNDEDADIAEPYICLLAYNVPVFSDMSMLVDYMNDIDDRFWLEDDSIFGAISVCYRPFEMDW